MDLNLINVEKIEQLMLFIYNKKNHFRYPKTIAITCIAMVALLLLYLEVSLL